MPPSFLFACRTHTHTLTHTFFFPECLTTPTPLHHSANLLQISVFSYFLKWQRLLIDHLIPHTMYWRLTHSLPFFFFVKAEGAIHYRDGIIKKRQPPSSSGLSYLQSKILCNLMTIDAPPSFPYKVKRLYMDFPFIFYKYSLDFYIISCCFLWGEFLAIALCSWQL